MLLLLLRMHADFDNSIDVADVPQAHSTMLSDHRFAVRSITDAPFRAGASGNGGCGTFLC